VVAGDLRYIRRLTYTADGVFVMQSIALSDLEKSARDIVADLTRGPSGIPGANTLIPYNLLRTAVRVDGAGQYRFLMTASGTAGVNTHAGLRLATALEVNEADADGTSRIDFYDDIEVGDVVTFAIADRRWYAYSIEAELEAVTPSTRLWEIDLLAYETTDGETDLSASEMDVIFRWSRGQGGDFVGVPGVTADDVIPEMVITIHQVPRDWTTDPLTWPPHPRGRNFRNNTGPPKVLVATISENGEVLSAAQHNGYLYQWLKAGETFFPEPDDPILRPTQVQLTTRRWLMIDARDVVDGGEDVFSCRTCLA